MKVLIPIIGFILWIGFIFLILRYVLSKSGAWVDFEEKYKTQKTPQQLNAKKLKVRQCGFGGMPMNNMLKFYESIEGLLICQNWIVKGSKYNLIIPWTEIVECRERKLLFGKSYKLVIGNPFVNFIDLSEKDFKKIKNRIPMKQIN